MAGSFVRPSLTIKLSVDRFDFDIGYLEGPSYFDEPVFRVLIHELTHFWQTVSMNFLVKAALSEWRQLIDYETSGNTQSQNRFEDKLEQRDKTSGLKPNDLLEAHALYWDVSILGVFNVKNWRNINRSMVDVGDRKIQRSPSSPITSQSGGSFDEVMLSDSFYSDPYRMLHNRTDSFFAALTFPIVVYFAFQTDDPVIAYTEAVKTIRPLVDGIYGSPDLEKRQEVYFLAIQSHVMRAAETKGLSFTEPRAVLTDLLNETNQSQINPLLLHYAAKMHTLEEQAKQYGADLNRYFALCGNVQYRKELMGGGPMPPLVQFADGEWPLQAMINQFMRTGAYDETENDELATIAKDIGRRWSSYRIAAFVAN
ncbi:hypothetical protein [Hoeflea poritis]|uniref:Uncharacterized protein n=1 Tax=Hoeflea poritis TaxID=2993659 RepID=A0ABT4VT23_9HYPH|nr:hypothetical protein [Hoeflea poritis]MDA4847826.1 hypothetical protein [Hoeflea poritis]